MPTHSSVPAWRIPGMGETGGLPSMGSHRVGHDFKVGQREGVEGGGKHCRVLLQRDTQAARQVGSLRTWR